MLEILCFLYKMRNSWNMKAFPLYYSNYTLIETTVLHCTISAPNW